MTVTIYKHKNLNFWTPWVNTHITFVFEKCHVHCDVFCTSSGNIWECAFPPNLTSTGWGCNLLWPQVWCSWRFFNGSHGVAKILDLSLLYEVPGLGVFSVKLDVSHSSLYMYTNVRWQKLQKNCLGLLIVLLAKIINPPYTGHCPDFLCWIYTHCPLSPWVWPWQLQSINIRIDFLFKTWVNIHITFFAWTMACSLRSILHIQWTYIGVCIFPHSALNGVGL